MDENLQERQKHVVSFQCDSSTTALLAELARRGDRSLSAAIRRVIREHVSNEDPGAFPSPHPVPAARDETSQAGQSNSSLPAGSGEAA
jgi:predicted ATPase